MIGGIIAIAGGLSFAIMYANDGSSDSAIPNKDRGNDFTNTENYGIVPGHYTITYMDSGDFVDKAEVPAETSITLPDHTAPESKRFVGWNTKADGKGETFAPGTEFIPESDLTLHALFIENDRYAIILPANQIGYTIISDVPSVKSGGNAILTYKLSPDYTDKERIISVNGNLVKLDALDRIYLNDIKEDKFVKVSGVYDKREYEITLPAEQKGYVLTSSKDRINHGLSYELSYKLLPGYKELSGFGIDLGDGSVRKPINGVLRVNDVRSDHTVTVVGVKAIDYTLTFGKNVIATVNDKIATVATVEDTVTISPAEGYMFPNTYNKKIEGPAKEIGKGEYKITGNVKFPSVFKIIAGEHIAVNNSSVAYVCPKDTVKVLPAYGYEMPDTYKERMIALGNFSGTNTYTFENDVTLPSLYSVTFKVEDKPYQTSYFTDGDCIKTPIADPFLKAYTFDGWDITEDFSVKADCIIASRWIPDTHTVYFGQGLIITHNGKNYTSYEEDKSISIKIKTGDRFKIKTIIGMSLPSDYSPDEGYAYYKNGEYTVTSNCIFPGVAHVIYCNDVNSKMIEQCLTIDREYDLLSFPEDWLSDEYQFDYWECEGHALFERLNIEKSYYVITPVWENM